ncbi:GNAT family N-acetyltransferase [Dyadobacter fermentans]|nr:GNAT family N-acetyltransferase [Dyadobacter fermentans]
MLEILVRTAMLSDLPVLRIFEQGVIAAERPFNPQIQKDPVHYYDIEELVSAPHIEIVVAETDGRLVGSGYARIEQARHYLKHQQHAYLGFMYVEPEYRGRGVNRKIIEALRQWAIARNINELRLDVYEENIAAIKAYEKAGFVKHLVAMRRSTGKD